MANSKHVVYKSDGPHMKGAVRVGAGQGPGGSSAGQPALPAGNGTSPVPVGVGSNVSQPSQLGNAVLGSMPAVNQINVSVNPDGTIGTSVEVVDATPVTGPGASVRSSSPNAHAGEVGVQTGWVKVQNGYKYYFIDESGNARCKTGWHYESNADGTKAWYYLDEDPLNKEWMVTGWKKITGPKGTYWYYFRPDGKMSIYWEWLNGLWYYLEPQDDKGNMTIGWKEINGEWYYFIPDEDAGYMMIGWLEIKGKWYYFYSSNDKRGIMAANHMVNHTDGKQYYLGADGAMVVSITFESAENRRTYIADENGVCTEDNSISQPSEQIGFISAKYETGGFNPGKVSTGKGDYGGISYGIPQFSSKEGSADAFVMWLKLEYPQMGAHFNGYKAGTAEFGSAWKKAADIYGDEFGYIQTSYIYDTVISTLVSKAKDQYGIDYERSVALRELIYSTGVQFHCGSLGLKVLGNVNSNMTDEEIVNASYQYKIANYKTLFKSSAPKVQESVKNRFISEWQDVLALID